MCTPYYQPHYRVLLAVGSTQLLHLVVVQNACPKNGHNVGSLFRWSSFKEMYSQWSPLYKDLLEQPPSEP